MPLYPFKCGHCGRAQDQYARVDDRDANPPSCCDAAMTRQLTAPMVAVSESLSYQCPLSGEVVTSQRRRKDLMKEHGVVDARDYTQTWARKRAKDAQERAEAKKAYEALPEAVKKAAGATAPV